MAHRPRRTFGPAVACLAASLMVTELVLTRVFSVIVWYHFAFFAISVALFGGGVAALVVHSTDARLRRGSLEAQLATACLALALSVVVVAAALLNSTPDWFTPGSAFTRMTAKLGLLFSLTALPFFLGGFALSLVLTRHARFANVLYGWDLAGAGLACLGVVPLLALLGGPRALLVAPVLATIAAGCFAWSTSARLARVTAASVVAAVGLVALAPVTGAFEVKFARGVRLADVSPEFNRWNSFSMVTVSPVNVFAGWGISPRYAGGFPEQKSLVIDMNALTPLTRFSGDLEAVRYALFDLSAIVYRVKPAPERVCIIGAGGGKDVLAALASKAGHVHAIEINPLIVEAVMRGTHREYTGRLYERPDVTAIAEDGRSFVRRTSERFDVVLLSMVDTSAATAAGAYALTENSLYTVEAFEDFLDALAPGGALSVSSVSMDSLSTGARLASIAREALVRRGIDPTTSVFIVSTPWLHLPNAVLYDVVVKPDGFSPAERATLRTATEDLGFALVHPGAGTQREEDRWIEAILRSRDEQTLRSLRRGFRHDVSPTTDDRPFFFYQDRLEWSSVAGDENLFGNGLAILVRVVTIAVIMVALFLLFPIFVGRRGFASGRGSPWVDAAYVLGLGLGFMFIEIALIQRLALYLGNPVLSLAVVLFVLLVTGGIGSTRFAAGDPAALARRIPVVVSAVVGYAALLAFVLPPILDATVALGEVWRAAVAVLVLAPLGAGLGAPLPAALRAVGRRAGERVAWLWAVNGATSVLAAILATLTSLHFGITTTLWVGAVAYALVLLLAPAVLRPDPA